MIDSPPGWLSCTESFSTWDHIDINPTAEGVPESEAFTVQQVIQRIAEAAADDPEDVVVESLSAGDHILFTDFPPFNDPERLTSSVEQVVGNAGSTLAPTGPLVIEAVVTDTEGSELDLPPIHYHCRPGPGS